MTGKKDLVHRPSHYIYDDLEGMDIIAAIMNTCNPRPTVSNGKTKKIPHVGFFWWGSALKYLMRWTWKGGVQDLEKCRECIGNLIEVMNKRKKKHRKKKVGLRGKQKQSKRNSC